MLRWNLSPVSVSFSFVHHQAKKSVPFKLAQKQLAQMRVTHSHEPATAAIKRSEGKLCPSKATMLHMWARWLYTIDIV